MSEPRPPTHSDPRNTAIGILRIVLWLMPSFFLTIAFYLAIFFNNNMRIKSEALLIGLIIIPVVIATAIVGYLDRRLALMQEKIAPPHSKIGLAHWTIAFVLAQIFIAPSICYAVLYGYCLLKENM